MSNKKNETLLKPFEKIRWKYALENSNIGLWDWNNNNNQVALFLSQESKRILGFNTIEEGKDFGNNAQDWNNRVHPDDKEKYFLDFKNHLQGLTSNYENEHRVLCNNGEYKWVLDIGRIIERDENGVAKRVIGTHTDITKRIQNENTIKNNLNLVTKQNKKLENFANIVTHNLKEQSGNFENLLELYSDAKTSEEKDEIVTFLKLNSNHLSQTIKDLKKVVGVQNNKESIVERIYVNKYINKVLKVLDRSIKSNSATINNFIDDNVSVIFNPSYLESIIQNLISNAIKYKHLKRDPIINLTYSIVNDDMYLNISDNGLGIDLDKYGDSIFGLYKTFHNKSNSEGVGLYLVKNQVESFGGKIDVSSEPNAGTTFTITLPIKKVQLN